METRTRSIIIGVVALLILAVLFGIIVYFNRLSQDEETDIPEFDIDTQLPTSAPDSANGELGQVKTFAGTGFTLDYPSGWGVLTCSNSNNLEFDPEDGADEKNVRCDQAVKSITVLVKTQELDCRGNMVQLGSNTATYQETEKSAGHIDYLWCVNVDGTGLEITHRFSENNGRAHSTNDYSNKIESIIKTIQPAAK